MAKPVTIQVVAELRTQAKSIDDFIKGIEKRVTDANISDRLFKISDSSINKMYQYLEKANELLSHDELSIAQGKQLKGAFRNIEREYNLLYDRFSKANYKELGFGEGIVREFQQAYEEVSRIQQQKTKELSKSKSSDYLDPTLLAKAKQFQGFDANANLSKNLSVLKEEQHEVEKLITQYGDLEKVKADVALAQKALNQANQEVKNYQRTNGYKQYVGFENAKSFLGLNRANGQSYQKSFEEVAKWLEQALTTQGSLGSLTDKNNIAGQIFSKVMGFDKPLDQAEIQTYAQSSIESLMTAFRQKIESILQSSPTSNKTARAALGKFLNNELYGGEIQTNAAAFVQANSNNAKIQSSGEAFQNLVGKAAQQNAHLAELQSVEARISNAQKNLEAVILGVNASLTSLKQKIDKMFATKEEEANAGVENLKEKYLNGQAQGILGYPKSQTPPSKTKEELEEKIEGAEKAQKLSREAERIKTNLTMGLKRWMGTYQVINLIRRGIRSAYQDITNLDKAMTNIAVVTDYNVSDLWGQINKYMSVAKQYGVTTQGVYEVSQLYFQQGLNEAETMAAATETLKMARIAGMDYSEAADGMTVAIRGFNMEMEEAARVTDVYSKVAAITASDTQELVTAMSKTASSAASVGSSFENTTAMLAVMVEATRESPQNIGSALKSIISRYGEMTKGLTKDQEGEDIDYNRVDTALKTIGITLKDTQGQFRDFDDVILELSQKWDTLDSVTQRYIATIFAGNRQQSRFLALVSNADRYMEVSEAAADSEDAGLLQYSKTLDSLETKLNNIKTSFQQFYMSLLNGDNVKGFLEFINNVLTGFTKLSKLTTTFNLIGIISGIKIVGTVLVNTFSTGFQGVITSFTQQLENMVVIAQEKGREIGEAQAAGQNAGYQSVPPAPVNTPGGVVPNGGNGQNKQPLVSAKKARVVAGLSLGGAVLSGIGSNLAAKDQTLGAAVSGAGNGMSIAAMALMLGSGNIFAAAIGGLTAIVSFISSMPSELEKAEEEFEKASKEYEEANIKRAESKEKARGMEATIVELRELERAQYDSAEAQQKFIDAQNEAAEKYPELVEGFESTGDAIIDLINAEDNLAVARQQAARAAYDAATAERGKILSEQVKVWASLWGNSGLPNSYINATTGLAKATSEGQPISNASSFIGGLVASSKDKEVFDFNKSTLGEGYEDYLLSLQAQNPHYKTRTVVGSFIGNKIANKEEYSPDEQELLQFIDSLQMLSLPEIIQKFDDAFKKGELESLFGKKMKQEEYDQLLTDYLHWGGLIKKDEDIGNYRTKNLPLLQQNESFSSLLDANTSSIINSLVNQNIIAAKIKKGEITGGWQEQFIDAEAMLQQTVRDYFFKDGNLQHGLKYESDGKTLTFESQGKITEYTNQMMEKYNDFYGNILDKYNISNFTELIQQGNLGRVTESEFEKQFAEITDFKTDDTNEAVQAYVNQFEEGRDAAVKRIKNFFENEKDGNLNWDNIKPEGAEDLDAFIKEIPHYYFNNITDFIKSIKDKQEERILTKTQGQNTVEAYLDLYENLNNPELKLNDKKISEARDILAEADYTSIEGITNLISKLQEIGVDTKKFNFEINGESFNISDFPVYAANFITEWENVKKNVATNLTSLTEELSDISKGVSLEKAMELSDTIEGLEIEDFQFIDGKWYTDNIQVITDHYKNLTEDYKNQVIKRQDAEQEKIVSYSESIWDYDDLLETEDNLLNDEQKAIKNLLEKYWDQEDYSEWLIKTNRQGGDTSKAAYWEQYFEKLGKNVDESTQAAFEYYTEQAEKESKAAISLGNLQAEKKSALTEFGTTEEKLAANEIIRSEDIEALTVEQFNTIKQAYSNLVEDIHYEYNSDGTIKILEAGINEFSLGLQNAITLYAEKTFEELQGETRDLGKEAASRAGQKVKDWEIKDLFQEYASKDLESAEIKSIQEALSYQDAELFANTTAGILDKLNKDELKQLWQQWQNGLVEGTREYEEELLDNKLKIITGEISASDFDGLDDNSAMKKAIGEFKGDLNTQITQYVTEVLDKYSKGLINFEDATDNIQEAYTIAHEQSYGFETDIVELLTKKTLNAEELIKLQTQLETLGIDTALAVRKAYDGVSYIVDNADSILQGLEAGTITSELEALEGKKARGEITQEVYNAEVSRLETQISLIRQSSYSSGWADTLASETYFTVTESLGNAAHSTAESIKEAYESLYGEGTITAEVAQGYADILNAIENPIERWIKAMELFGSEDIDVDLKQVVKTMQTALGEMVDSASGALEQAFSGMSIMDAAALVNDPLSGLTIDSFELNEDKTGYKLAKAEDFDAFRTFQGKQIKKEIDSLKEKQEEYITSFSESLTTKSIEDLNNLRNQYALEEWDKIAPKDMELAKILYQFWDGKEGFSNWTPPEGKDKTVLNQMLESLDAVSIGFYEAIINMLQAQQAEMLKALELEGGAEKKKLKNAYQLLVSKGYENFTAEEIISLEEALGDLDATEMYPDSGTFKINKNKLSPDLHKWVRTGIWQVINDETQSALDAIASLGSEAAQIGGIKKGTYAKAFQKYANQFGAEQTEKYIGQLVEGAAKESSEEAGKWNSSTSRLKNLTKQELGEKATNEEINRHIDELVDGYIDTTREVEQEILSTKLEGLEKGYLTEKNRTDIVMADGLDGLNFLRKFDAALGKTAGARASAIFDLYAEMFEQQLANGEITAAEFYAKNAEVATSQLDQWLGISVKNFGTDAIRPFEEGDLSLDTEQFGKLFVHLKNSAEESLESFYFNYTKGINDAGEIILDIGKLKEDNRVSEKELAKFQHNFVENTISSAEEIVTRMTSGEKVYADEIESFFNDIGLGITDEGIDKIISEGAFSLIESVGDALALSDIDSENYAEELAELRAKIVDILLESISNGFSSLGSGLEGTLGVADYQNLVKRYGLTGVGTTKSSKGVYLGTADRQKLISQKFIEAQNAGLSAEFGDQLWEVWRDSTEDSIDGYTEIDEQITTILGNTKEWAKAQGLTVDEAKAYVEALQQARSAAMFDENAAEFAFMEQDAVDGLTKSFDKFVDNIDKVKSSLEGLRDNKEMGYNDFYNIIDYLGQSGQWDNVAAQLGIGGMAIENFANTLISSTETIGKIDAASFKALGIDIGAAATAMADGMNEGLKETARSQIKYLTGLEQMLMALAALEAVGDIDLSLGIDINGDNIEDGNDSLDQLADNWARIFGMPDTKKFEVQAAVENKLLEMGNAGLNDLFKQLGLGDNFYKAIFGENGFNIGDKDEVIEADFWGTITKKIADANLTQGQAETVATGMYEKLSSLMTYDEKTGKFDFADNYMEEMLAYVNGYDYSNVKESLNTAIRNKLGSEGTDVYELETSGMVMKLSDGNIVIEGITEESFKQNKETIMEDIGKWLGQTVTDIELGENGKINVYGEDGLIDTSGAEKINSDFTTVAAAATTLDGAITSISTVVSSFQAGSGFQSLADQLNAAADAAERLASALGIEIKIPEAPKTLSKEELEAQLVAAKQAYEKMGQEMMASGQVDYEQLDSAQDKVSALQEQLKNLSTTGDFSSFSEQLTSILNSITLFSDGLFGQTYEGGVDSGIFTMLEQLSTSISTLDASQITAIATAISSISTNTETAATSMTLLQQAIGKLQAIKAKIELETNAEDIKDEIQKVIDAIGQIDRAIGIGVAQNGSEEVTDALTDVDDIENSIARNIDIRVSETGSQQVAERLREVDDVENDIARNITIRVKVEGAPEAIGMLNSIKGATGTGHYAGTVNNISGNALAEGNALRRHLLPGANLANKTLVGELGPELAVYNGKYHLLGAGGAEFVTLPKGALVFNHLQTRGILNGQMNGARAETYQGYAKGIQDRMNGSAMVTGNVSGPALAGGIAGALAAVRRAKSVWQGLLNSLSAADLLGGGGGGGGGGGDDNSLKAHIADLQEWYNLSRKIADIEGQINILLAKRKTITDGHEYLRNLRKTQALLEDQVNTQEDLLRFQELQLKRQAEHINTNSIWSRFLEVDENGLLQYIEGNETNGGKGALEVLSRMNEMSGAEQLAYVRSLGWSYTTTDDEELEDEELVAKFYEELQKQIDDYDALRDTVVEAEEALADLEEEISAIDQEIRENEIELSEEIYDIIVSAWEENIENLKEQNDLIKEANEAYAEGIQKALDDERKQYESNQAIADREQLQRQLSLLRRSGGEAVEIADLESQLDDMLQEEYFKKQEEAIEKIRDANERQVQLMEQQVKLQEEALEYEKENGVIWTKTYEVMQGTDAEILSFMQGNSTDFFQKSFLAQEDLLTEWSKKIGIYNEEKVHDYYEQQGQETLPQVWETEKGKALKKYYDEASQGQKDVWIREYNDQYADAIMEGKSETEAVALAQNELLEHIENYKKALEEAAARQNSGYGGGSSSEESSKSSSSGPKYQGTTLDGRTVYGNSIEQVQEKIRMEARKTTGTPSSMVGYAVQQQYNTIKKRKYTGTVNDIGSARYKGTLMGEFGPELAVWNDKWHLIGRNGPEMRNDVPNDALIFNHLQTAGILKNQYSNDFFSRKLSDIPNSINSTFATAVGGISNNDESSNITIQPGAIVLEVQQLNDQYDIDKLYNDITDRVYSIASKASGRGVSRR